MGQRSYTAAYRSDAVKLAKKLGASAAAAQRFAYIHEYAVLLASIEAILAENIFNKSYGKRRMYEKLQLDYDCAYSYNTVAKVLRENGMLHERNQP